VAPSQTPLGELTALPQIPYVDFRGPREGGKERRERGEKGEGREVSPQLLVDDPHFPNPEN